MDQLLADDFDVDLYNRRVVHKPSGMWFTFYEYADEENWKTSDSVIYHNNPKWPGSRMELAAAAKAAAIQNGMRARKPPRR
jgi:hypothetical protein